ncbi:MAG: PAS domain-containing protein [Ferrovibrio sp.]|uniref:PAS domain-containing protein n=1 Tax=Ferrovibrio sp. TaxID=1917215 RepID=UPI00261ED13F|nr:PAS domain-containing protein [Ferrovibrio sp.]MCW0233573.1 PAS domain-containing protein [Ferrovibrio sp.]
MMQDSVVAGDAGGTINQQVIMAPPGCWPALTDPRFRSLLRHWAERRQGLMAPRHAIDPAAIRGCLPHVWLYQYLPAENDFLCTLAGEKVNEAWGQSLIGKRASLFMPPPMREHVPKLYRRMLEQPALQVSRRRITPADGVAQSAERLILPLAREDGSAYGVFGLTLYYLGAQSSFDDPLDMQGAVTLYDCAGLPASPP